MARFAPIARHRLIERIDAAAQSHVTLIVAPAGYGKSVALGQYLAQVRGVPWVRYDILHEDATLLGFARGLAEALHAIAPDARRSLSGAYERSRSSSTPAAELASWLYAHIKAFDGIIAVDDLHHAEGDPEITKMLVPLIERTRGGMRWILASRTSLDLPRASWIAYGDMEMEIDERDLRFTLGEARETATQSQVAVRDDELQQMLDMTEAWPTALNFALRTSMRSADLRNIDSSTREMVYRYLAEQVYKSLAGCDRDVLRLIAFMPEIELDVLRAGGIANAATVVEALRDRLGFIYREREGTYRCHDLFADYLRHEAHLLGDDVVASTQRHVANALERAGRTANALAVFAQIHAEIDILRILHARGLDLAEHAHSDAVDAAIAALSDETRRTNAVVLGLRGLQEYNAGRFDRAQSLLERAISCTSDRVLQADLAVRLAAVLFHVGRSPIALLSDYSDSELPAELRARICSVLLVAYAHAEMRNEALATMSIAEEYVAHIDRNDTRARLLHRMAVAAMQLGLAPPTVMSLFIRAEALASESGQYITAAAALGGLESAVLLYEDDLDKAARIAQQELQIAQKSGDRLSVQTALLQRINIEMRSGAPDSLAVLERQFSASITTDLERLFYIVPARAMLAAWRGNFEEAYRLQTSTGDRSHYAFDRVLNGATVALYALGSGRRDRSVEIVSSVLRDSDVSDLPYVHAERTVELARALCAIAEAFAGRTTSAQKVLAIKPVAGGAVVEAARACANTAVFAAKNACAADEFLNATNLLRRTGYGGTALLLECLWSRIAPEFEFQHSALTAAEREILNALADGQSPKEIATVTGRSTYTIQSHIQNAIKKLGCSGRAEAVSIARRKGLINFQ